MNYTSLTCIVAWSSTLFSNRCLHKCPCILLLMCIFFLPPSLTSKLVFCCNWGVITWSLLNRVQKSAVQLACSTSVEYSTYKSLPAFTNMYVKHMFIIPMSVGSIHSSIWHETAMGCRHRTYYILLGAFYQFWWGPRQGHFLYQKRQARNQRGGGIWGICPPPKFSKHC